MGCATHGVITRVLQQENFTPSERMALMRCLVQARNDLDRISLQTNNYKRRPLTKPKTFYTVSALNNELTALVPNWP